MCQKALDEFFQLTRALEEWSGGRGAFRRTVYCRGEKDHKDQTSLVREWVEREGK